MRGTTPSHEVRLIFVDTSVWIDHLRKSDETLRTLLLTGQVLTQTFVIGELALGSLGNRDRVLRLMDDLPTASQATDQEVRAFIESHGLAGSGVGYVDVHLLAAARLSGVARWTRDKRLLAIASERNRP
jgi:predicted nucleic acid-binding protein